MNNLTLFSNPEFGEIRAVTINGDPWFVGKDVAEILGYRNSRDALAKHVDDEDKNTVAIRDGIPGNPNQVVINESGLYSLILSSKLPTAKKFKHWVTSEVLPCIRKAGGYIHNAEYLSDDELFARALHIAESRVNDLRTRNAELTVDNQVMQPKAEYFDELVDRNLLMNFRDTAKALGLKQRVFINFLLDHSYIYRDQKGNLMPRSNEKADGLFEVKQCTNQKTKWAGVQTMIAPKGVETFRLLCRGMQ